jgi:hypothetical protein
MSRSRLPLVVLVLALLPVVAGCGGQNVSADEVPGPPVALTVPEVTKGGSSVLAGNSATPTPTPTPTPTATPTAGAATGQSGSTTTTTTAPSTSSGTTQSGGTTTGGTQQTQQSNGQSQSGGQQPFDDFCKNNPGAC